MQAITVRWIPVTNHRLNRYKAECAAGYIITGTDINNPDAALEDHDRDIGAHRAAYALALALDWKGRMVEGVNRAGNRVYVFDHAKNATPLYIATPYKAFTAADYERTKDSPAPKLHRHPNPFTTAGV